MLWLAKAAFSQLRCPVAMGKKKASSFGWLTLKGNPSPRKKKKKVEKKGITGQLGQLMLGMSSGRQAVASEFTMLRQFCLGARPNREVAWVQLILPIEMVRPSGKHVAVGQK